MIQLRKWPIIQVQPYNECGQNRLLESTLREILRILAQTSSSRRKGEILEARSYTARATRIDAHERLHQVLPKL